MQHQKKMATSRYLRSHKKQTKIVCASTVMFHRNNGEGHRLKSVMKIFLVGSNARSAVAVMQMIDRLN